MRFAAWLNATPEAPDANGKPGPAGGPRREDIERVLGYLPLPPLNAGQYLVDVLFRVGPVDKEAPINEAALEVWERRRGIALSPWEADTLVDMSRAYLAEMYAARQWAAMPPYPPAVKMWKYVRDQLGGAGLRETLNDSIKDAHGTGKRHRN